MQKKTDTLNILMINTFVNYGGASIACNRLIESIQQNQSLINLNVSLLTIDNQPDSLIQLLIKKSKFYLEKFHFLFFEKSKMKRFAFSTAKFGTDITKLKLFQNADVIHLHWINHGFLSIDVIQKILNTNKKIFWTFHDMWPFTGGCHHSGDCIKFENKCKDCVQFLKKPSEKDLSYQIFNKKSSLENLEKIKVIAISDWMESKISKSSLFKNNTCYSIPNPIDLNKYKKLQVNKQNEPVKILYIGAVIDNYFKGFQMFLDILINLKKLNKKIEIILVGEIKEENLIKIPFKTIHYGTIKNDEKMVEIYNSSNIFISTSPNESFSYTSLEALACNIPVLAFNTGELKNLVQHKQNGYLINHYSLNEFINGYLWYEHEYVDSMKIWQNLDMYSYDTISKQMIKSYLN